MNKSLFISFIWKLLERGGAQLVQVIIQLMLARLLGPSIFGRMSLILVFTNLFSVFVEGGFNSALIQKKNVDKLDYSTILVFSTILSVIFYLILFALAPAISKFYEDVELINIIRVLGIILFPLGIYSVQGAYLSRNNKFKSLFFSNTISLILSGLLAIILAVNHYGIWVLVIQQITFNYLNPFLLLFLLDYRISFNFSTERLKDMFKFGMGILSGNLIYSLYLDLRNLLIGKYYAPKELGFYQRGELVPKSIITNFDRALTGIIFPELSIIQDDAEKIKKVLKDIIELSAFVIYPMSAGLFIVAEPLILVILGAEWTQAIQYLRIFSIIYSLWPILSINLQSVKALGRSEVIVRMEFVKRIIGLVIIVVTLPYGPYYIALGNLLERVIEMIINSRPNKKLINFSMYEQLKSTIPSLKSSALMILFIYPVNYLNISMGQKLIIEIIGGFSLYLVISMFTNRSIFIRLRKII